jgi:hypothetical protein
MSVAFILNPGYNTINNIHHTFWDVDGDAIKNSSLTQALEVSTSVTAPSHVVTGGTDPAQFYMLDATTLATDAPIFKMPIGQAPTFQSDLIGEFTADAGISVQSDMTFEVDSVKHSITGVDELTCGTLHYTTLDPAIPSDASAWSTFPATQDVDLAGNTLTSSTDLIKLNKDTTISKPIDTIFTVSATDSTSANLGSSITCNAGSDTESYSQLLLTCNSGKQDSKSASGFFNSAGSGVITSGNNRDIVLESGDPDYEFTSNIRLAYSGSKKAYTINKDGALNFNTDWNGTSPIIEGSFGTAGQIIASQGSALPPQWVAAPTASAWSEYPAIADVDFNGFHIKGGAGEIVSDSNMRILKESPQFNLYTDSQENDSYAFIGAGVGVTDHPSGFACKANSYNQSSKPNTGFTDLKGAGVMTASSGQDLVLATGDASDDFTAGNTRITYKGGKKAYTQNFDGALSFNSDWNGTGAIIEGSFGTAGQVVQSNGSADAPSWVSLPVVSSSQYVYYVSKDGTVDAVGDVNHPLSTIQAAITLGQADYPRQVVILIAPGVYTETLSITLPNITLSGYSISQQQNLMTHIVGSVGVSCSASQDLFYSQVCFQNLQISGLLYDNSSVVHTLNIEGCRISANGAVFAQLSTADNRTRLSRCTILQSSTTASTDPILKFSSGLITLSLLDVTARNNAPVLQFDGSAKLQACGLCTFDSTTTSATAAPIVYIAPTSAAGYTYAFGYNSFSYSSLVPRAFSSGKNCGISCESGTGHPTLIITYNAFNLLLCDATCFVVQDVKKADAAAYTDIRFFSNSSTYLATGIDSTHKTTLAAVA